MAKNELMNFKCSLCDRGSSELCIDGDCYFCNLEEQFYPMSQREFESQK